MIVKHKRTGKLYKFLCQSFSVERQKHSVVYMELETGYIFDRDDKKFGENFEDFDTFPQNNIIPKEPHE